MWESLPIHFKMRILLCLNEKNMDAAFTDFPSLSITSFQCKIGLRGTFLNVLVISAGGRYLKVPVPLSATIGQDGAHTIKVGPTTISSTKHKLPILTNA